MPAIVKHWKAIGQYYTIAVFRRMDSVQRNNKSSKGSAKQTIVVIH